jgi:hypothetical protein
MSKLSFFAASVVGAFSVAVSRATLAVPASVCSRTVVDGDPRHCTARVGSFLPSSPVLVNR